MVSPEQAESTADCIEEVSSGTFIGVPQEWAIGVGTGVGTGVGVCDAEAVELVIGISGIVPGVVDGSGEKEADPILAGIVGIGVGTETVVQAFVAPTDLSHIPPLGYFKALILIFDISNCFSYILTSKSGENFVFNPN